jgi:hypothetical protein
MNSLFTGLVIIFGVLSAICWIISSLVKVKANGAPTHSGWGGGSVQDSHGNDVVQTLMKQSRWNSIAAIFGAAASISQAIATYL